MRGSPAASESPRFRASPCSSDGVAGFLLMLACSMRAVGYGRPLMLLVAKDQELAG
jgi:hypothetical protein